MSNIVIKLNNAIDLMYSARYGMDMVMLKDHGSVEGVYTGLRLVFNPAGLNDLIINTINQRTSAKVKFTRQTIITDLSLFLNGVVSYDDVKQHVNAIMG